MTNLIVILVHNSGKTERMPVLISHYCDLTRGIHVGLQYRRLIGKHMK